MDATDDQTPAPTIAAAIDIGSNTLRMVIAEVDADGGITLLEQMRQPVRLGHDAFVDGRLSNRTVGAVVTILRDYRRVLDTYDVSVVRAVATSAVREASNRDAFVDRVARTVDIDVDVIEPTEQSRLIVQAVRQSVGGVPGLAHGVAMVAEVGGGGTLVTVLRNGEIAASQSYNLGSIRMQEMLATASQPPRRAADMLRQHIHNTVDDARRALHTRAVTTFVAIGGDARFAADRVGDPIPDTGLRRVSRDALGRLIDECVGLGPEALADRHGIPFADAETLVAALLVYQALLEATRADGMVVSQVSMRDGLLLDLPRFVSGREDPALTRSIITSARAIAAKYHDDAEHGRHVAELALRLFDELQREHGLTAHHRLLLRVAALLHEVGKFVNSRAHHKHSQYLISNAEIFGLRRSDITIVSHVGRYHRRSVPKSSHLEYMGLPREQRMVVNKLAAILRVADALDKGHWQQVRDFTLERQERDLVIHVTGAMDLTLERRALALKSDLFEDIFGYRVRLEEDATAALDQARTAAREDVNGMRTDR